MLRHLRLARNVFAGLTADTDGAPLVLLVDDAHLLDDLSALIVHQLVIQDVARVIATIRTGRHCSGRGYRTLEGRTAATVGAATAVPQRIRPPARTPSSTARSASDCAERMWVSESRQRSVPASSRRTREAKRVDSALVDGEWRSTATPSASPSLIELVEHADRNDTRRRARSRRPRRHRRTHRAGSPRGACRSAIYRGAAEQREPDHDGLNRRRGLRRPSAVRRDPAQPVRTAAVEATSRAGWPPRSQKPPRRRPACGSACFGSIPIYHPTSKSSRRAANISASRLDLGLAERLARAAVEVQPDPVTKLAAGLHPVLTGEGTNKPKRSSTASDVARAWSSRDSWTG